MKKWIKVIPPIATLLLCCGTLQAQISMERQVIGSTGSFAVAGNMEVSATVGEAVIPTLTSGSLIVTQGFQQADSISTNSIEGISDGELKVDVYPNPTGGDVFVEIAASKAVLIELRVYNAAGQIVAEPMLFITEGASTRKVNFAHLAAGVYFIELNGQPIKKVFTIEKVK